MGETGDDRPIVREVARETTVNCYKVYKLCGRPPHASAPCKLTFDLLTLKVVSDSRVTWPTSVPILVFLNISVLDLGPMYATDRRQTSDAHHRHLTQRQAPGQETVRGRTAEIKCPSFVKLHDRP